MPARQGPTFPHRNENHRGMTPVQQENVGLKLLEAKLIPPDALQKAQQQIKTGGGSITQALVKLGVITEENLAKFLADLYSVPAVDLGNFVPDPSVTKFIPGFEVQPVVAPEAAIKKAIDKAYDSVASFENVMKGMEDDIEVIEEQEDDTPDVTLLGEAEQAPVVKLVNSLITDAVRKGSSDIHIEPYEKSLRVRFRIDGTLYEMMAPPFRMKAAIISRLKIMAELDIAERRVPQDGRIKLRLLGRTID